EEDVLEVAGHGNLFYGIGELALRDPQSAGASRVVAGHHVDPEAKKLGHVQAFINVGQHLLRRAAAWLQEEVARANPRITGPTAGRVAGGLKLELLGRVSVQQVG